MNDHVCCGKPMSYSPPSRAEPDANFGAYPEYWTCLVCDMVIEGKTFAEKADEARDRDEQEERDGRSRTSRA